MTMGYASAAYQQAHAKLKRVRGPASDYTCSCGRPALDWAYLFTGEEMRSVDGSRPYSTNPDDYEAMCRKCHIAYDTEHDPVYAERRQEGNTNGRAKIVEMSQTDPEYIERMNEVRRAHNAVKVQCGECDDISTRGGMANHQKWSGHKGRKELG